MNRRAVLGSLAALGTASAAGCLDAIRPGTPTTALQTLMIRNRDSAYRHTFSVRVRRGSETVHQSVHDVERSTEENQFPIALVDCTWGSTEGRYVVSARVDGGKWYEFDLTKHIESGQSCVEATINHGHDPDSEEALWVYVRADCDYPPEHGHSCRITTD